VLSRDNAAVVVNEARRILKWAHRLGGELMYRSTEAGQLCQPPRFQIHCGQRFRENDVA
jgi:hypothetical protein